MAGLAAFAVLMTFEPVYQASHLLKANNDYLVYPDVMPTLEKLAETEKPLFFRSIVIDPVLADAEVRKAPSLSDPETAEATLRKKLKVNGGGTPTQLVISYEDSTAEAAAMVCNAVVDSYLRQRDEFDNARMADLVRWLGPEIASWEAQVRDGQDRVQRLSKQTFGYTPGQRAEVIENQSSQSIMTQLRSEIVDLESQMLVLDAQRQQDAEEGEPTDDIPQVEFVPPEIVVERREPTESEVDEVVSADPKVKEAESLVERYKSILLDIEDGDLVRVRKDYYREMQGKRDEWLTKLRTAKEQAHGRAVAFLDKRADEEVKLRQMAVEQNISVLRAEFNAERDDAKRTSVHDRAVASSLAKEQREDMETTHRVLTERYRAERLLMETYVGVSTELQFAQEDLAVANDVLTKLRNRSAAIQTERRQDGAVRSLAIATPPKNPVEALPTKKLAGAATAAFFLPFLLGVLWEFKVQRVTNSAAVEKHAHLAPIVGEVAKLPAGTGSGKSRRMFEESIDTLRSNLFLSVETKNTRTIAVVSSMSAEGKSSVASQLALSIAKATGNTVLLVDADLRCPDQHDIFGLEMGPGFCGVLSGETKFEEAVDTSLGKLVHVLPAGRPNRSPHRLINEKTMQEFVDRALEDYAVVVIDTAPVLAAGETIAIASVVDATLLCLMRDVSRMEHVTRTTRRLEAAGATIAGTVFSGVTPRQYAYRYGDYHFDIAPDARI